MKRTSKWIFSTTPVEKFCRLSADRVTKPENSRTATRWRWIPRVTFILLRLESGTKRAIECRNSRSGEIARVLLSWLRYRKQRRQRRNQQESRRRLQSAQSLTAIAIP